MTISVKEYIEENYPFENILIIDGFDEAFVGVGHQFHKAVACYDKDKIIECLIRDNMTWEEALEYFEFNIAGSYVGERTPIIIERFEPENYDGEDL